MPPKFTDILTLGAGHSMMINHMPQNLNPALLAEKYSQAAKMNSGTIEKFGLFSSDIDYNTYFPDVTPEQFNPEDSEFIEPVFRLLSNCIVSKNYMPTEFPADVLKASMPLMVGQTVNCDHETNIGNAIGTVKEVFWQESYTVDGKTIPAGMNGVLKIDGKANPRIARGINMDPPSIHSNSVTVQFEWKPSHQFGDPYEFWEKLGTYDDKGEMVRRIATKIISYKETSLVSHGADPYAQKVDDKNHIINPGYADSVYNSFSEEVKVKMSRNASSNYDFKVGEEVAVMHNTSNPINKGSQSFNNINNNKNSEIMPTLQEFLEKLFGEGMLTLAEGAEASVDLALSTLAEVIKENTSLKEAKTTSDQTLQTLTEEKNNLETANQALKEEIAANATYVQMGKDHFAETKENAMASYKKLMGDKVDANIVTLIEKVDSLSTLQSLKATYDQQLEEKFPMACADCGSHNINRASSVTSNKEDNNSKTENTADVLSRLAEKKR